MTREDAWDVLYREAVKRRFPMDPMTDKHRISTSIYFPDSRLFGEVHVLFNTGKDIYVHSTPYHDQMFQEKIEPKQFKFKSKRGRVDQVDATKVIEAALELYMEIYDNLSCIAASRKKAFTVTVKRVEKKDVTIYANDEEEAKRLAEVDGWKVG